ncbi:hydrogenase nickel incorporation protein HypB [Thermosulfurimonas dismutans]|uniref:[NiFe] hydrogenase nickel incorporation-associated protein HypB n=1 Tax=Thermosulfurimonas dismutans TaxID=999894 RepID=A0A179D4N0_9BACT|nr:hydrogenase nickel incorporation protein HypB [Thermosulfurimonas dismutans]OAQ20996.1 [NiFe] hydrogenase nickel incorporation-associated protein HypB [Thermosulfurimonas dismutans]
MCESCGCGERSLKLSVEKAILSENERLAQRNRKWFKSLGLRVINLVGSPGSGKTSLIEATAQRLSGRRLAVIEGDPETRRDAERLQALGIPVAAVTTGGVCHLDARMVHRAFHELEPTHPEILFIENVGNLLCPADFDLGEDLLAVVLSVTEGEDKPEKYPQAFRRAKALVITKIDLLPYVDFDLERVANTVLKINPELRIFPLSVKTGEGLSAWLEFLGP